MNDFLNKTLKGFDRVYSSNGKTRESVDTILKKVEL